MAYTELEDSVTPWWRNKQALIAIAIGVILVCSLIAIGVAFIVSDTESNSNNNNNNNVNNLQDAMDIAKIMTHLSSLQNIAYQNNGSRSPLTGYNASVAYVVSQLEQYGYKPSLQIFSFPYFMELETPQLEQTFPENDTYYYTVDFRDLRYSGSGDVEAFVISGGSGCQQSEFVNFTKGSIALIAQNLATDCLVLTKINNALALEAAGIIMYAAPNQQLFTRTGLPDLMPIPGFSVTNELGMSFLEVIQAGQPLKFRMFTNNIAPVTPTMNVIADTPSGDPTKVIVVGAHLDSVLAGPGINDDGSGTGVNLELAIQLTKASFLLVNKVRFAWWAAEESGLLGSTYYVNNLNSTDPAELKKIALNLNFDMLGSPNFFRGVYNGSSNSYGSAAIESLFVKFFTDRNVPFQVTPFDGRSDYGPFIAVGIPAGGLFTGAEVIKTPAQRALYGGIANAAYDPCYHLSCDTTDNIDQEILLEMSQSAAYVVQQLVMIGNLTSFLTQH